MKKICRSLTALTLVACLLFSVCSNGVFVFAQQQKTLYYVSMGDSMTNGLGMLSGYDAHGSNGYMEIASDAYPAQLSAWLAGYDGPISPGQSTYKGTNGTVKLTQLATSGMRSEDLHYILTYGQPDAYAGDDYMYQVVLEPNGRWNSAYAGGAEKVSANFRDSIASADLISLAVGNANLGIYMSHVLSLPSDSSEEGAANQELYVLENALANVDSKTANTIQTIYDLVYSAASSYLPEELAKTMGNRICYVAINYLVHYNAALDEIVKLNPDAEIMIIGLFNAMSETEAYVTYGGQEYHVGISELGELALSVVNHHLSILPSYKKQQEEYKDITFYYAKAGELQTLASTLVETYEEDKDFFRKRFITDIAQMAFPLLMQDQVAEIDLTDVNAYETALDSGIVGLTALAQQDYDKAYAAAAYLALEEVILSALRKIPHINADEVLPYVKGSEGLEAYFEKILGEAVDVYHNNVDNSSGAQLESAAKAFIAVKNGIELENVTQTMVDQALTDAEQLQQVTALAELYVTTDALSAALTGDERIPSMLSMYGRMALSSGMNSHPNYVGHDTITDAVIKGLENGPLGNTHSYTYHITTDSYYLALGDSAAYGASANDLAKRLSAVSSGKVGSTNKTAAKQTAEALLAALPSLTKEIERADLITLGFNINQCIDFVLTQLKCVMTNKEPASMHWEEHLKEQELFLVQMALGMMREKLADGFGTGDVMGLDLGQAVSVAIESFAYSYVAHLSSYAKVMNEIHTINPDAQIMIVGMYNPMQGVVLDMEDAQLDVGEYMQYLLNIVNMRYNGTASINGNYTFVKAPDVETSAKPATYELVPFLMELLMKGTSKYNPTTNGYAYIEEQLWNALAVTEQSIDEHKHEYCDWYVFKAATGEEEGLKRRDCLLCDHYEELKLPVLTGPGRITSDIYMIGDVSVSKIAAGTTAAQFLQGIHEAEYVKIFKDGKEISQDTAIGTGMEVRLVVGNETVQSLTVVVTGDVSGDGAITITDMLAVKSHVLNKSKLESVYLTAGDTSGDGAISITDFIQIKAQILGKGSVAPQGA